MTQFEFISYTPVQGEKHLGIAAIKLYGKIILRYKIVQGKDGKGFFPSAPNYKITDESGERWVSGFMLDSRSENEEVEGIIRNGVNRAMHGPKPTMATQGTIFPPSTGFGAAPSSNDDCPF